MDGECASSRVCIGSCRHLPRPAALPFPLRAVMAAPLTLGAATRGEEDDDCNRPGAGAVSNEGEYGAPEVRAVCAFSAFSRTRMQLAGGRTHDPARREITWVGGGQGWGPEVPAGRSRLVGAGCLGREEKTGWHGLPGSHGGSLGVGSSQLRCGVGVGQIRLARSHRDASSFSSRAPCLRLCLLGLASGEEFFWGSR